MGRLPAPPAGDSPDAAVGGEPSARRRLTAGCRDLARYGDDHDDMAGDRTSRLSPYLRFGCVSPLAWRTASRATGAGPFVRQLCWRDFYYQVTAAFPRSRRGVPARGATEQWRDDDDALEAWREGRTGIPIVDAGMRQLLAEGWMHNRARLITASLPDQAPRAWTGGPAAPLLRRWLLDGDVANNYGNWQWVAGTGNDTKPYRRFNPIRQAATVRPGGDYVRR